MASTQVTTYPGAVDRLLKSPGSNVARELAKFGARVESRAKMNATHRPGPMVDTGNLRASIGWHLDYGDEITLYIGWGMPYGIYLEKGWMTSRGRFVQYPFMRPAIESLGGSVGSF